MTQRRQLVGLASLVAVALVVAACGVPQGSLATGVIVPDFDLPQLGGGAIDRDALNGDSTPVVLNFWATWCAPCKREIPALQALHEGGGVRVIAIAVDETAEIVQPFVDRYAMTYPIVLGDMATFVRFGGRAIPYTVILDADLVVRRVHTGLVTQSTLEKDLAAARTPAGS
ncbi:MAG: TlpA disulfide reductase family protein [Acidobacteriota bacterium]